MSTFDFDEHLRQSHAICLNGGDPAAYVEAICFLLGSRDARLGIVKQLRAANDPLIHERPIVAHARLFRQPTGEVYTLNAAIGGFLAKKAKDCRQFAKSMGAIPGQINVSFGRYLIDQYRESRRYVNRHEPAPDYDDVSEEEQDFYETSAEAAEAADVSRLLANRALLVDCVGALQANADMTTYLQMMSDGAGQDEIAEALHLADRKAVVYRRDAWWGVGRIPAVGKTVVGELNSKHLPAFNADSQHVYVALRYVLRQFANELDKR